MLWDESYDDLKLVGGAGLVQSGNGQNTFTGNVDASSGLDVTGAAFTKTHQLHNLVQMSLHSQEHQHLVIRLQLV